MICLPETSPLASAAPLPRATNRASEAMTVAGCFKPFTYPAMYATYDDPRRACASARQLERSPAQSCLLPASPEPVGDVTSNLPTTAERDERSRVSSAVAGVTPFGVATRSKPPAMWSLFPDPYRIPPQAPVRSRAVAASAREGSTQALRPCPLRTRCSPSRPVPAARECARARVATGQPPQGASESHDPLPHVPHYPRLAELGPSAAEPRACLRPDASGLEYHHGKVNEAASPLSRGEDLRTWPWVLASHSGRLARPRKLERIRTCSW